MSASRGMLCNRRPRQVSWCVREEAEGCVTVDEAAAHLRQMLLDAGFRFDRPDPALAWEVFKRFVAVPVASAGGRGCEEGWFEACDGGAGGGGAGHVGCVRGVLGDAEGGGEHPH